MSKILFASNNIVHFVGASSNSTTGTFSPTRVPYSIRVTQNSEGPVFLPSDTDDTWFHFRIYPGAVSQFSEVNMITAFDSENRMLFRLYKPVNATASAQSVMLYNGNTSSFVVGTVNFNINAINTVDIQYKTNILGMEISVYVNGVLNAFHSFASNPNNYGKPTRFRLNAATGGESFFSEFFIANGDTRNGRLHLLRPSASGAYTDWLGTILSLIDEDLSTSMSTLEPNAKQSLLISPYTGSTNIANIAIVSNTNRGDNSPTKMRHLIRQSGVDYVSPDLIIPQTIQYNITDNEINPATSLPWVSSDLSGIEVGFVSVA